MPADNYIAMKLKYDAAAAATAGAAVYDEAL
jgi:hypothetical protein